MKNYIYRCYNADFLNAIQTNNNGVSTDILIRAFKFTKKIQSLKNKNICDTLNLHTFLPLSKKKNPVIYPDLSCDLLMAAIRLLHHGNL